MRRFPELLQRFGRDERGVFAVFFAIIAIVLIATSGAVVDFTSLQQSRTRAQTALDSAALALQPKITTLTTTQLQTQAQAILSQQIADSSVTATVNLPTVNLTEGSLEFTARITKPTSFVKLVGVSSLSANLISQATRKQLDLEVAMVLDNSGSMSTTMSNGLSRITNLQRAARCATDVLFNGTSDCSTNAKITTADALAPTNTAVRIGLVPFTEFVNVGTGYRNATWMDQTGSTAVSRSGFDSDDNAATPFTGNVDRFALYTTLGIAWQGCVEARNHTTGAGGLYYDTSDLTPTGGTGDSLFDPTFSVDEKSNQGADDGGYPNSWLNDDPAACTNHAPVWTATTTKTVCTIKGNNASNFNSASCSTSNTVYAEKDQTGAAVTPAPTSPPATLFNNSPTCTDTYTGTLTSSSPNRYTNVHLYSCVYPFSDRELQERLCKYAASNTPQTYSTTAGPGARTGPNAECPNTALLPLTTTKSNIITRIKAMSADGGTNIHQGIMWGYHALSPTEPLTEGKSYTSATSKVIIAMTDGENTNSYNSNWVGGDWYTAYGYPYNGRLTGNSDAALEAEMDARTETTCTNAKNSGITIFTIGLQPPNQTTIDMLTNCATDASHAYFPSDTDNLTTVFQTIAQQLADLRLAK